MRIRLIIGREGLNYKNKSNYVYEEIGTRLKSGRGKMYLLVPEQFTLGAERELMALNGLNGLLGADVLSFTRLEYRILSEVGGIAKTFVDDHGRQMLLQKSIREVKKELTVYKKSAGKPGFLENISTLISELKQSEVMPEALEAVESQMGEGRILSGKLKDIRTIYTSFSKVLGTDRMDKDDRSFLLCQQIPKSDYLKQSLIWIDGFHTFSARDFKIIRALAEKADCLTMTLSLDSDKNAADGRAFDVPRETLNRLDKMAAEMGIETEIIDLNKGDFKATTGLSHLERNLFALRPQPYKVVPKEIKITQCKNIWNEVERGACKIVEWVREKEYRYSDIVVLASDMEIYGGAIKRAFAEYGIPFFMDDVKKVTENNFLEAVLAALEAVGSHYTYETMFTFIKTGFSPLKSDEAQDLENYVVELGIRGSSWKKPFTKESNDAAMDLLALNQSREKLMLPFNMLGETLRHSQTYGEKTKALVEFLEAIQGPKKIDTLSEALREKGDYDNMGLYHQIWNILMEVFDQINSTMGLEKASLEEYISVLKGGFQSYTVGIIPNRQDVVNITDLMRSRSGAMKALLVLGVNEGVLPRSNQGFNLLSERERDQLRDQSVELQNNGDFQRAQENFGIYSLFSKPEETLHLSFAMADADGGSLGPSPLIARICGVFPGLKIESALEETLERQWEAVAGARGTLGSLTEYLREMRHKKGMGQNDAVRQLWQAVAQWYQQDPQWQESYGKIQQALDYEGVDDQLSAGQAVRLFEPPVQASVSRLERYRKCPFSHYVGYGLKPQPRKSYEVEPPDIGTVLHHLIDEIYKEAAQNQVSVSTLSEQQTDTMVDRILDKSLPQIRHQVFNSTGQYQYLGRKLRRVGKRTVRVLVDHMQKGSFDFKYSEQQFNQVLQLPNLNETVKVRGVIDRVDVYEREGKSFVKVIDYKSGNKTLNLAELYYGISLQLAVYMEAGLEMLEGENLVPGGTFYFHIDDPVVLVDALTPESVTAELNKAFQLNGLYLDDPLFTKAMDTEAEGNSGVFSLKARNSRFSQEEFEGLLAYVRRLIVDMTENILKGDIAVRPYKRDKETGCQFCEYNGICQFDATIGKASYDVLKKSITKEMFLEKITGGENHEMD